MADSRIARWLPPGGGCRGTRLGEHAGRPEVAPYDLHRFSTVGEGSPLPRFNKSKTICIVILEQSEGVLTYVKVVPVALFRCIRKLAVEEKIS